MAHKKYSVEYIKQLLSKHGTITNIERETGISADTCAKYLKSAGIPYRLNELISDGVRLQIIKEYEQYRDKSELAVLAKKLGIHYDSMKRIARENGLTDKANNNSITKDRHRDKGHPLLGKKATLETKKRMAESTAARWADPKSSLRSEESLQKRSDKQLMNWLKSGNIEKHSRTKTGWFVKEGKYIFMRSTWELNYAHYLNFLVAQRQISAWEYEVDTFWFEAIKRGVRSYKPDFKVTLPSGTIEYHEVKGWLDNQSQTKLKRMALYHPKVKIVLIRQKQYDAIKKISALIPSWGTWVTENPNKKAA